MKKSNFFKTVEIIVLNNTTFIAQKLHYIFGALLFKKILSTRGGVA